MIKFILKTETYVGINAHKNFKQIIDQNQYSKIGLLLDEGVKDIAPVQFLRDELIKNELLTTEFHLRGNEEPDYDYLDQVVEKLRKHQFDFLIAVGGGSTLDMSKAISVLLTNPGKGIEYRGFDMVKTAGIPLMAIPSTAGTGSEVTINAVFTNKSEKKKLGINGNYMSPKFALIDPAFTISAPLKVAVSAGVDAMVHTLESFAGTKGNLLTKPYAKEAFVLLYHNLSSLIDDPQNLEKRLNIQLGAYYAAISLFNSCSGIAGAISYPLGVHFHIPHGIGGGMIIPHVVEYNVSNGYHGYNELYDLIENADKSLSPNEKAQDFSQKLSALFKKLNVPTKFSQFNVDQNDYAIIKNDVLNYQAAFDFNPVPLKVENVGAILDRFF